MKKKLEEKKFPIIQNKELVSARALLLLIFSASFIFLMACGKKEVPNSSISKENTNLIETISLNSKAIIGNLDWFQATSINPNHPASQLAKAVGLITIPHKKSRCTAFIISTDIIMTNWHCFPNPEDAIGAQLYLNFTDGNNKLGYLETPSYQCEDWIMSNEELDVALLKCAGNPGKEVGILTLEAENDNFDRNNPIYVIHQNCDYYSFSDCAPTKKVSLGSLVDSGDAPEPARSHDLFYTADTLGGSSGSPVFSLRTNKVIALHHNGHGQNYWSAGRGIVNSGMPMPVIVRFLNNYYPEIRLKTSAN